MKCAYIMAIVRELFLFTFNVQICIFLNVQKQNKIKQNARAYFIVKFMIHMRCTTLIQFHSFNEKSIIRKIRQQFSVKTR